MVIVAVPHYRVYPATLAFLLKNANAPPLDVVDFDAESPRYRNLALDCRNSPGWTRTYCDYPLLRDRRFGAITGHLLEKNDRIGIV